MIPKFKQQDTRLTNLENSTPKLISATINTTYLYSSDTQVFAVQIGKIVFVDLYTVAFINNTMSNHTNLITGLPKAKSEQVFTLNSGYGSNGTTVRCIITTAGTIQNHYDYPAQYGNASDKQYGGFVMYEAQ